MNSIITCAYPVLDEQKRARPCGATATTIRTVARKALLVCATHAAEIDAKREAESKGGRR